MVRFVGDEDELKEAKRRSQRMKVWHAQGLCDEAFPNPSSTFSDVVDALLKVGLDSER